MTWRRARWAIALVVLAVAALAAAVDVWGVVAVPAAHADAIVVMGCPPNDDGTVSDCLRRRVERGVALFKEGRAPSLVLTGGELHGLEAEARVAARYALDLGVPGKAIVLEPMSQNTWENARYTQSIARVASVIVVTDDAHVLRATRCFHALGVTVSASGVSESPKGRVTSALRELAALADYWFLDRLGEPKRPPSAAPM